MHGSAFGGLRLAVRRIRLAPGFSAVAVLSLGLGIGGATAIFSLVEGILLEPLAYRQSERLVLVREVNPALQHLYPALPANLNHFKLWRAKSRSTAGMAAFSGREVTLAGGGAPAEMVDGARTSVDLLAVLGVEPRAGRWFLPAEEAPGHDRVVVIADSLWHRRFGAAPGVLGQAVTLDGTTCTVIGILSPSFRFPRRLELGPLAHLGDRVEVFRPLGEVQEQVGWGGDYDYNVIARLRPGVSPAQARAELDLLESAIDRGQQLHQNLSAAVQPLREVIASPVRSGLYALLAGVGVLLAIVCVNLANLVVARASGRSRELSIRLALGASTAALVRELLAETLLLAGAGGLLGAAAARVALRFVATASSINLPRLDEVGLDGRVLLFAFVLALVCGLITGLVPALRLAALDPQSTLRTESHTITESGRAMRLREILVGCEAGLGTVLLVLAGLLAGSVVRLLHVDRGWSEEQAVAVRLRATYPEREQRAAFFTRVLEEMRALPGTRQAALVSRVPLTGESNVNGIQLEGADRAAVDPGSQQAIEINVRFVSSGYFAALGIPLLHGRAITEDDGDGAGRAVTVVSAGLAAKLWPGREPVGRRFSTGAGVGTVEVIGVVKDVHNGRLDQGPTLIAYVPWQRGQAGSADLVLRTAAPPGTVMRLMRQRIAAIDPAIAVPQARTMADVVAEATARWRFEMQLVGGFALTALLLAALGIYGVVAFGVAQRRAEIGIRIALGAGFASVTSLVVGSGLRPVLLGVAAGLPAAVASAWLLRSVLFGVSAADPLVLAAVALTLPAVGLAACLLPAIDAVRTDPAAVLRAS